MNSAVKSFTHMRQTMFVPKQNELKKSADAKVTLRQQLAKRMTTKNRFLDQAVPTNVHQNQIDRKWVQTANPQYIQSLKKRDEKSLQLFKKQRNLKLLKQAQEEKERFGYSLTRVPTSR